MHNLFVHVLSTADSEDPFHQVLHCLLDKNDLQRK